MAIDRIWCCVSKKRKPHRLEAEVAHAQKAESQTSNHGAQLFAAVMVGGNKPTPACLLELKARLLDTTFQTGSKKKSSFLTLSQATLQCQAVVRVQMWPSHVGVPAMQ